MVRIPTSLRNLTQNQREVRVEGATVAEVLQNLAQRFPGLGARLFDEQGKVRRYLSLFLNDEDIRAQQELATPVSENDSLSIIPAIAGG